jgi:hypothetical protein
MLALVGLSLLPAAEQELPGSTIALTNASVTLYPLSDPVAAWHFTASNLDYQPESRQTTLYDLVEGARTVAGERDFSLTSDEITIDLAENLLGNRIEVHLLDADWLLKLQGRTGQPVLIDQSRGKFFTPILDFTGRGLGVENHAENVSVNFDLTDFVSDCREKFCVNQFADTASPQ